MITNRRTSCKKLWPGHFQGVVLQRTCISKTPCGCKCSERSRIIPNYPRDFREAEFTMPIYEFRCKKCNNHIEVFQKLSDKPPTRCRKCGGRLEKQFSRTSVQFKGE